jgi:hypothetical protein
MIAYPPHILTMARKVEQANQNIDLAAIARRKNEGGGSDSLRQGADDLQHYEAVDSKSRHRRLRVVVWVADAPVSVCSDGREKARALYTSAQAARDPRRQTLAASVFHDLWHFSCEMPDAPRLYLCENSSPP